MIKEMRGKFSAAVKPSPSLSPAMIKHGSTDVRAIRQVSSAYYSKVKGRPTPGYKATAQDHFADWDECTDQDAQAVSFFKMFGCRRSSLRIHFPIVNDKPSDRIKDSAANIENSRGTEPKWMQGLPMWSQRVLCLDSVRVEQVVSM